MKLSIKATLCTLASLSLLACSDDSAATDLDSGATETEQTTMTNADSNTDSNTDTGPATVDTSSGGMESSDSSGGDGPRQYEPETGVEFIDANGQTFGYFSEGAGPLVMLLHGFPDTPHTFDELRAALAKAGFRAVSPFMRGYAPSTFPDGEAYDPQTLGEDVLALMDALGEEQAFVVGHDWGATAAYAAASLAPERVTRLVTIAIPHPGFFQPDPGFFKRAMHFLYLSQPDAEDLMRADDFAHVNELYARWAPTWDVPDSELEAVKNAFSAPGSLNAALGYYRAGTLTPPKFLTVPLPMDTLTIAGADDGVTIMENFTSSAAGFSGEWTLLELAGGHFVHRENPGETIPAIVEFISAPL
ncbi:MAG: alpha/beta hydrolase [Nannocystaceae bacterium]|nr:alpha/beta hydrolase [Nannocystaceae bacterium]